LAVAEDFRGFIYFLSFHRLILIGGYLRRLSDFPCVYAASKAETVDYRASLYHTEAASIFSEIKFKYGKYEGKQPVELLSVD
jgi:hypothetical protein